MIFRTIVRSSRELVDAYAVHQVVSAIAHGERVLWALPTPGILYIQSENRPDWTRIPGAFDAAVTPATTRIDAGVEVAFGLIGNPVRTVGKRRPDGSPSNRPGRRVLPLDERPAWLHRKLSPALHITSLDHNPLPPARGRAITISRHLYAGTATVTDPAELAALITAGVGAGKGLGCGLLLVEETK